MKAINKTRSTNKFCITGGHIRHMAEIAEYFTKRGDSVVAIANDDEACRYTVRVIGDRGIYDHLIENIGGVRFIESHTVAVLP